MSNQIVKRQNTSLAQPKKAGTLAGLKHTQVNDYLNSYIGPVLKHAVAKHLTPEKVMQVASSVISRNPYLAECTMGSLLAGIITSAQLGLSLRPELGQAYLVPYNNRKAGTREAQFILGYQGLIQLARNSGEILNIDADLIYEGDEWEIIRGVENNIIHKPSFDIERTPDKVLFAYAIVKYKDGGFNFSYLTKKDIEKYRGRSQAGKSSSSPWNTDFEAMAKKTAILRLKPYLPKSEERIEDMIASEGRVANFNTQTGEIEEAEYSFENEPTPDHEMPSDEDEQQTRNLMSNLNVQSTNTRKDDKKKIEESGSEDAEPSRPYTPDEYRDYISTALDGDDSKKLKATDAMKLLNSLHKAVTFIDTGFKKETTEDMLKWLADVKSAADMKQYHFDKLMPMIDMFDEPEPGFKDEHAIQELNALIDKYTNKFDFGG